MIVQNETKYITTNKNDGGADFGLILNNVKDISQRWESGYVDNSGKVNFNLDSNLRFHYRTKAGQEREADITETAFTQLCARVGVPGSYIKKCFESGKADLALHNFRTWADDTNESMFVRERDGVVRAVLSDSYRTFDGYRAMQSLKHTVDFDRFIIRQYSVTEDDLFLRFVDREPLMTDHDSPLFIGFTISNSDVGKGAFSVKFSLYRQVCTNGLIVTQMGGTMYQQRHAGEGMNESKFTVLKRCFRDMDTIAEAVKNQIAMSRKHNLKDYELRFFIEKANRELRLSAQASMELEMLIHGKYEPTKWGVVNGVTELSQKYTLDTRRDMETWAGGLLASA